MSYCDLHMHSTASDGTDAPQDLAKLAQEAGVAALALTDHDTTAGLAACAAGAAKAGLDFAPGIELSADPWSVWAGERDESARMGTMHILGLFIAYEGEQAEGLKAVEARLLKARAQRNPEMVAKLNELGVHLDDAEVEQAAGGTIVGRPHIAQVMVRKGYVRSIHEAFSRYIGQGGAAYVRKDRLTAAEAIEAIHQAGGVASLAHPVQLGLAGMGEIEHVVVRLKNLGLDAIETRHSDHTPGEAEAFERLAAKHDLLTTGGSDYHGQTKAIELGSQRVPIEVYERLRSKAR